MTKVYVLTYSSTAYDGPEVTIMVFSSKEKVDEWVKVNMKHSFAYHNVEEYVVDSESFVSAYADH